MRGCRGGVSPCAGLGGSPGATQRITKKEKNKMRVPEQLRSSLQWERLVRATPKEAARVSEQATKFARVGNGRFRVLQGHYLIRHILRRQQARPHSTFAALGHLPKKGMAAAALFAHTPKKTANSEAFNRLRQPGKPPGARLLQAGSSPCEPGIIPGSFSCPCGRKSVRVRVALWRKLCYTVHAPSRRGRR